MLGTFCRRRWADACRRFPSVAPTPTWGSTSGVWQAWGLHPACSGISTRDRRSKLAGQMRHQGAVAQACPAAGAYPSGCNWAAKRPRHGMRCPLRNAAQDRCGVPRSSPSRGWLCGYSSGGTFAFCSRPSSACRSAILGLEDSQNLPIPETHFPWRYLATQLRRS